MTSPINPSLYAAHQPATQPYPALEGEAQADFAIVGGGLTGLSASLYLAERGVDVALVEAGRIAGQASGRNGGQALQGLAAGMDVVERAVGLDAARAIWEMTREALCMLTANIRRFGIDCGLAEHGYVYAAAHSGQLAALDAWRARAAQSYGYPDLVRLDRRGIRDHVGSAAYVGGLYDPQEVHLDPLAYALGLAQAAQAAGARLHEQTRARSWQAESGGYRIALDGGGSLRCRQLLLAVNTDAASVAPALARRFVPVESFIVATAPLTADLARSLLPSGAAVADCNRVLNYFRLNPERRLLFGGRASGTAADRADDTRRRMLTVFPQLADTPIDYAWGGLVDVTPHKLPHFGRLDGGVYFAQGFAGHGLALTGLAGKLVAEAATGSPERFDRFAALPQHTLPTQWPGFNRVAVTAGMAWYQGLDWVERVWHGD